MTYPPSAPRAAIRSTSRTAATTRAVTAILAVAAIVVVPPLLLASLIGDPLPHHIPTGHTVTGWLRSPLSNRAVLDLVAVVAWAAWAHLLSCLVVETARQARGATWRIPIGGVNQRLAQHLVAAVLIACHAATVSGLAAGSLLTPATAAAPPTSVTLPAASLAPRLAADLTPAAPIPRAGSTVVTDTTVTPAAIRHGATPIYKEYLVKAPDGRHHDTLWDIAARHLGDPLRWKQIFALNDGRTMPDGHVMTQASLILPGWVLRMPADAHGLPASEHPPVTAHPTHPHATVAHHDPHDRDDRKPLVAPPPPATAAPEAAPSSPSQPPPNQNPSAPTQPEVPAVRHHAATDVQAPITAGLAVAALGLLAALDRRRRIARRRRAPGTRLARPSPDLLRAEADLRRDARAADTVAGTVRLAVALVANSDPTLTVRAAWHHPNGTVELTLDTARSAPEPFTESARGWQLATTDQSYLFAVGDHADPAPLLVPVGTTDGAVCYVNLEVPGLISITGPTDEVDQVISAVARSLAGAPWARELTQMIVPPRLAPAVTGLDRVEVNDPDTVSWEHLISYAERIAALVPTRSLAQARRDGDEDTIAVTVLAGFTTAELPEPLRTAATLPGAPVVAVLAGPDPNAQIWTWHDNVLTIPGIGTIDTPPRTTPEQTATTTALLEQALDAAPAPPEDTALANQAANCPPDRAARPVEILVLGPVEVRGVERVRRTPVLALILYLALHRRPITSKQALAALWPDREHNGHVLRTRMSEARTVLGGGINREGHSWVLADTVGCDWQRFQALSSGDTTEQLTALSLVRGRPFQGYDADWIHLDGYLATVEAAIVDLALTVAERALADNDPDTATVAATAGLRASPYDERLYRIAMKAAAERGATGEVTALRRQLDRALEEDVEPDDYIDHETLTVYQDAVRGERRATG
jgi:DNA-binding SARP family transcriptional activator